MHVNCATARIVAYIPLLLQAAVKQVHNALSGGHVTARLTRGKI